MLDAHIHLEQGEYTLEWVEKFIDRALDRGIDEIWLLEHSYRFKEFVPMYQAVRAQNPYVDQWLNRKAGVHSLSDYLSLVELVRAHRFPVRIRFGLEVCYFKETERFVQELTKNAGLDFLVGSVHFVDGFAFDHKPELWNGMNVDAVYRRYFEIALDLARSGIFDGMAHPDSIKLFGHKPSFSLEPYYERLANALAEAGVYAEQNSGIARRCSAPLGMEPALLLAMKRRGVRIVTASDAHCPEDVGALVPALCEK